MQWLVLIYKIPREPTAGRVYVWRKLKQIGAVSLQDAAWVLPAQPRTREQLQWLATEIVELGGEVSLMTADVVFSHDPAALREAFEAPVRDEYEQILIALKRKNADLAALAQRYVDAQSRDYFRSPLGEKVRAGLLAAEGDESK